MKQIWSVIFCTSMLYAYNLQHLNNLQSLLNSKQKNINISHVDFRGLGTALQNQNLSGVQACGALFNQVSGTPINVFSGLIQIPHQTTDLSNVNFSNADLTSANFAGVILHNVNFANANIAYVNFSNADLTGVQLNKAKNIELAMFCNAIMPDGTKPTGSTWTSSNGTIIQLHCAT